MLELKENALNENIYLSLRECVNWKKLSEHQAKQAIEKSLFNVTAYVDGVPAGMGRVIGDGAVICYIQDLVVLPEYQKMGIGKAIMQRLISYVEGIREEGTEMMLCLMCAKGRESFYEKLGFIARPTDSLGPGMTQYLKY
ncbi:MAG: GNAT family N-acetyltransferase [Lachnospiraceae bacterium]|nr:GNAT family N-acetyltransferase [Lachnospiraceae bacterium]MDE6699290.1 GNAT family N-acetyltransferase [Lachnospiraceae bacterium]